MGDPRKSRICHFPGAGQSDWGIARQSEVPKRKPKRYMHSSFIYFRLNLIVVCWNLVHVSQQAPKNFPNSRDQDLLTPDVSKPCELQTRPSIEAGLEVL
jgi:hypothetical protein